MTKLQPLVLAAIIALARLAGACAVDEKDTDHRGESVNSIGKLDTQGLDAKASGTTGGATTIGGGSGGNDDDAGGGGGGGGSALDNIDVDGQVAIAGTPKLLDFAKGEAVSINNSGFALGTRGHRAAAYLKRSGNTGPAEVWVARFDPSGGWGAPVMAMKTPDGLNASYARAEIDAQGRVYIVVLSAAAHGQNTDASLYSIDVATAAAGQSTFATKSFRTMGESYIGNASLDISASPSGDGAALVWTDVASDGKHDVVMGSVFKTSSGWEAPAVVQTALDIIVHPKVELTAKGDVVAIWLGGNANDRQILAAQRPSGAAAWSTPKRIDANLSAGEPTLAASADGSAMAAWWGGEGGTAHRFFSALYTHGSGWAKAQSIEAQPGNDYYHFVDLAAGKPGQFFALWDRYGPSRLECCFSSMLTGNGSWPAEASVNQAKPTDWNVGPNVAADLAGRAYAAWLTYDKAAEKGKEMSVLFSKRDPASGTWSTAQILGYVQDTNAQIYPLIQIAPGGHGAIYLLPAGGTASEVRYFEIQ